MPPEVLVLVHDDDPSRGPRMVGSLRPAFEAAGHEVRFASFVGAGPRPPADPAGLRALVVMGSSAAAYDDAVPWLADELEYLRTAVDAGTPVLGVCFGGQALARVLGGVVTKAAAGEHGFTAVESCSELLPDGPWMEFHSDTFTVPPDAQELARTPDAVQAFVCGPHLGLQFHPEIDPDSFAAWRESWALTGIAAEIAAAGVPVAQIAAEIEARAAEAAARCAALVGSFLSLSAAVEV